MKSLILESQIKEKIKNNNLRNLEKESSSLEISINRNEVKLDNMLNILSSVYELTFERAKNEFVLDIDPTTAREKVTIFKANIKRIGMINLGAIEEYERVNSRYEFLTKQKDDLNHALTTLLEIMNEMDEVMKEEFKKTFDLIRNEFKKFFNELFKL